MSEVIYNLMREYKEDLKILRQLASGRINVSLSVRKPRIINKPINAGLLSDTGVSFVNPNTIVRLVFMNDWQLVLLSDCDKLPHLYFITNEFKVGELMDIIILDHYYHFIIKHELPSIIKPLYTALNKFANDDYSTLIFLEAGFPRFIRASIVNDSPSFLLEADRNVRIDFPGNYDEDKLSFINDLNKISGGRIVRILRRRIKFYKAIIPIMRRLNAGF